MSVNLCAQEGEEPRDVVLHFDVRFHRDNIISLSRKNGIWIGSGNYDTNYNMFVPGKLAINYLGFRVGADRKGKIQWSNGIHP